MPPRIHIATAGWSIPGPCVSQFPAEGTHLQRYATRFHGAEINSSFYRPHRPQTYAKWAAGVPADFRFAVKFPKAITHTLRLRGAEEPLEAFLHETAGLGAKLGPLLIQLPPSLIFEANVAGDFFTALRAHFDGLAACEPRHASWFTPPAEELLARHRVARVAADPAKVPAAAIPGGWDGLVYYRLHGSPRMYYSSYADEYLSETAAALRAAARRGAVAWCVFDNTASGAAMGNALELSNLLDSVPQ